VLLIASNAAAQADHTTVVTHEPVTVVIESRSGTTIEATGFLHAVTSATTDAHGNAHHAGGFVFRVSSTDPAIRAMYLEAGGSMSHLFVDGTVVQGTAGQFVFIESGPNNNSVEHFVFLDTDEGGFGHGTAHFFLKECFDGPEN
jgi:hypothetical protein